MSDIVTRYWPANSLFPQVSINYDMDVQNQSYGYDNAAAFSRYWRTDVRTVSRLTTEFFRIDGLPDLITRFGDVQDLHLYMWLKNKSLLVVISSSSGYPFPRTGTPVIYGVNNLPASPHGFDFGFSSSSFPC